MITGAYLCISILTYLTAFVLFLPKTFVYEVILVETKRIFKVPDLDFGEFLRFIGIWMLIKANPVMNRAEYFSEKTYEYFQWVLSSCQSFYVWWFFWEYLLWSQVHFHPPPPLRDKFYWFQNMIVAWNDHIQKFLMTYWISFLHEYMSVWMNKFIFPGFVFYPCKPHTKGNKYHTICCFESGMTYIWESVDGMDNLVPMGRPELKISSHMKTIGFMLQLTRSVWSTGKAVIMDSDLCVLKGLL